MFFWFLNQVNYDENFCYHDLKVERKHWRIMVFMIHVFHLL
jgi:hypothetical protein